MKKVKLHSIVIGALSTIVIAAAPAAAIAMSDNGNDNPHNNITICHATGSQTNPFVVISPNANGVVSGHESHQDSRDIIPPFDYNTHGTTAHFAGQNWDTNGQNIFNNGCQVGGQGGGPQKDCDGDFDNSPAAECNTTTTTTVTTGGQGQVLSANTSNNQVSAGVQQTPQGGVNAGAGGGSSLSLSLSL